MEYFFAHLPKGFSVRKTDDYMELFLNRTILSQINPICGVILSALICRIKTARDVYPLEDKTHQKIRILHPRIASSPASVCARCNICVSTFCSIRLLKGLKLNILPLNYCFGSALKKKNLKSASAAKDLFALTSFV